MTSGEGQLFDRRRLPLFIHSEVDDMGLSPEAFRVYAHLARRAGKDGRAWPGVESIGEVCFAMLYSNPDVQRRHVTAALRELVEKGLVEVTRQYDKAGRQLSNSYHLLPILPDLEVVEPRGTVESPPSDSTVPLRVSSRKKKETQPKPAGDKRLVPVLAQVMWGVSDLSLLMGQHWGHIHLVLKKLAPLQVSEQQVLDWYQQTWLQTWPGKQKDGSTRRPMPSEVVLGVAAHCEKQQAPTEQVELVVLEDGDDS